MTMPKLNLLVLRARDPARLSSFYAAIGLGDNYSVIIAIKAGYVADI